MKYAEWNARNGSVAERKCRGMKCPEWNARNGMRERKCRGMKCPEWNAILERIEIVFLRNYKEKQVST